MADVWLLEELRVRGRIKVVCDVDMVSAVSLWKRAECVDVAHRIQCSLIECGVTASLCDLDAGGSAVALHLKRDVNAMSVGLRIEHPGVPLRRDLLLDLLHVPGETRAES